MLSSKFNLYNAGWLDVVFANRNQTYGAYELRKNYSARLAKSLLAAVTLFVILVCSPAIYKYFKEEPLIEPPVELLDEQMFTATVVNIKPPKKIEVPAAAKGQAKPVRGKSVGWTTPKVVDASQVTQDVPATEDLMTSVISTSTQDGPEIGGNVIEGLEGKGGNGTSGETGNGVTGETIFEVVEHQPMFPGGLEAFANYLRKNLRYPAAASEIGVTGRVFVNFIVEKDGSLTDIKVVKGIGHGCDEEAVRVLKKSPRWAPGIQNQQRVRVMFTIPIVFQME
ncbi:energy transducer TonB [Desertivirga xinjiangensis]|uniref:energy transducer TonB n=1 Tax=Desertivirga xinjiangensis TaxID=539206 RepID=UPI00210A4B51|nr:energy transducer TonB [Pedobacter xinjiangensis]